MFGASDSACDSDIGPGRSDCKLADSDSDIGPARLFA